MKNQFSAYYFRRHLVWSIFSLAISTVACLPATTLAQQKAKLGFALAEDHPQGKAARFFAERVNQSTGGRIQIQTFSDSRLGDDKAMISALQSGVQELSIQSTSPFVGTVKEFGLLDLPFIFSTEKQADAVLDGAVGQKLLDGMQSRGLVGLAFLENGFRQMTNNRRPIQRVEDIQGLKLRVMQSPVFIDTVKQLGANPTPLPFSELYVALETGAVDGQENPFAIIDSAKLYEVQKFVSVTNHVYNAFIITAGKPWWDKLSPSDQNLVKEAAIKTREYQRKLNRDLVSKYQAQLQKSGVKINTLPSAELKKMSAAVASVRNKYTAQYDPILVKEFFHAIEVAKN